MGNFNYSVVQRLLSEVTSRVYFIFIKMTQNGSPSAAKTLEEICEMDEMKKKTAVTSSVLATANILRECPEKEELSSLVLALRERFSTSERPLYHMCAKRWVESGYVETLHQLILKCMMIILDFA